MADTYVQLPSGQYVQIPEGASPDQLMQMKIKLAGMQQSKAPSFMDAANQSKQQLLQSKASPSTAQPDLGDTLRNEQAAGRVPQANPQLQKLAPFVGAGIGAGAVAKGGAGLLQTIMKMAGAGAGGAAGDVGQQLAESGKVNPTQSLHTGEAMAAGEGLNETAISPFFKWLTSSKSFGAKMLQAASSKAGNAPVELSPQTNEVVDDIVRAGKLGGHVPKVVSDLLERVGPSTKQAADAVPGPLTYDEARIVQGNLSDLSVNEVNDLKGPLKYLMPKLARSFSQDVQAAADQAGAGAEHGLGMKEYAQASGRNTTVKNIAKVAGLGTGAAATAYGALEGVKRIVNR